MPPIRLATRNSPLALAQAKLVAAWLATRMGAPVALLPVVSTGDRQTEWSLEKTGGKGLFTAELEAALLRADARDVLVSRTSCRELDLVATSSPRRRIQLAAFYPGVKFTEIRGNVDTRLNKIARGAADATVLAAAGLTRLWIEAWPGLKFSPIEIAQMVPAIGQAAIAIQCRVADTSKFGGCFDAETKRAVKLERARETCPWSMAAALSAPRCSAINSRLWGSSMAGPAS